MISNQESHMSSNGKDYKVEIELLKKDISSIQQLNDKMEASIDKIETAASDISRVLTLHEYKTSHQEQIQNKINKDLEDQLDKHIQDSQDRSDKLNKKIEDVDDKIEKVNTELTEKIQQSQATIVEEMLRGRVELRQEITKLNDNFGKKIGELDAWRYMVMGAIAFIVFIIGNISGITTVLTKLFR